MNRLFMMAMLLGMMMAACKGSSSDRGKINTLTKAEAAAGWKLLFNGKDLSNWKIYNGGEVSGWKIIDGILHNSGVGSDYGGDIITRDQFSNFELYLEWKVAPQSNSGIFFHVVEQVAPALYKSGPEYQLIDDNGWKSPLKPEQLSGANYDMHAPAGAKVRPIDEWNTSRLVVNGARVEHWLNDVKVVEYELWTDEWKALKAGSKWAEEPFYGAAARGHIGLQDHGGLTMFRNVKIREL